MESKILVVRALAGTLVGAMAWGGAATAETNDAACFAQPTQSCVLKLALKEMAGKAKQASPLIVAIGRAQVRTGRLKAALATVSLFPAGRGYDLSRAELRRAIAVAQVGAGRFDDARATLDPIPAGRLRVSPLVSLGVAAAKAGRSDIANKAFLQARETAAALTNDLQRRKAFFRLAELLSNGGHWDLALKSARAIRDPYLQAWSLGYVAGRLANAKRRTEASKVFREAVGLARTLKLPRSRVGMITKLCHFQGRSGNAEDVAAALGEAFAAARAVKSPRLRLGALSLIARGLEATGSAGRHTDDVGAAIKVINAGGYATQRPLLLLGFARAQARAPGRKGAKKTFAMALEATGAVKDTGNRLRAISDVARAQAEVGLLADARRTAAKIPANERLAKYPHGNALSAIAKALVVVGQHDQAAKIAREILEPWFRDTTLDHIARSRAAAGDFKTALALAHKIERGAFRVRALRETGRRQIAAGRADAGLATLRSALNETRAIKGWHSRGLLYAGTADALPR